MLQPLQEVLQESVGEVLLREQTALEKILEARSRKAVLFGSGTLGRRALSLLQGVGADVLAFCDNNSAAWGSSIDGIPVLSPQEAAERHGKTAVFFVTIWNDRHWFSETKEQLTGLGCDCVSTYTPIFWKFPETFLTLLLLNEPPHRLYEDKANVLRAEALWADEESLRIYRANIAWRALGNASDLPGRPVSFTYFPQDIFLPQATDIYLDCGAFDGDTVKESLEFCPQGMKGIYAVEADSISFDKLTDFIHTLPEAIGSQIHALQIAIGEERCQLRFECNGSLTSKASEQGVLVECFTIDEIFKYKPVSIIKMDIEGAEYGALLGGREVIERDRPILAICVYHTQNDIWRIPLLVHELLPEHKLYLRSYEGDGFQTVLYAISPERSRVDLLRNGD
jgi:FkbM family methyltransferase